MSKSLPRIKELLQESWQKFAASWKILIGLELISWLPMAILFALGAALFPQLAALGKQNMDTHMIALQLQRVSVAAVAFVVIAGLIMFLLRAVVWVGQVHVIDKKKAVTLGEALRWGQDHLLAYIKNGLVLLLIIAGWAVLMMAVMALVPVLGRGVIVLDVVVVAIGAYIGIRLMFALPLAALGKNGGFYLHTSWFLTAGLFWPILGRLAGLMVVNIVIGLLAFFLDQFFPSGAGQIIADGMQIVLTMYCLIFIVRLLHHLRAHD